MPVWNPLSWDFAQFNFVIGRIFGSDPFFRPAMERTLAYVVIASALCLLIAYPVAYFTARFAGRWKGFVLAALIAPFWISYMMRMLAWVNLLQTDGLLNRTLSAGGVFDVHVAWLQGHGDDGHPRARLRLRALHDPAAVRRAGPDPGVDAGGGARPGASRCETFRRVTWPLTRPAVVVSLLLTSCRCSATTSPTTCCPARRDTRCSAT